MTRSRTSSDPVYRVSGKNNSIGLLANIRLPRGGLITNIQYSSNGSYDGVAVIYDTTSGTAHEMFQYDWNNGSPQASIHKTWDIKGLGHGTASGQRLGTSASGVAMLFGILRGDEINTTGHEIGHALQIGLPAYPNCAMMLSKQIVLPATSRDAFASNSGYNTGNIPYGALMALPRNIDINSLGLSEPGRRLARALQNYGAYVVDNAGCGGGAMRADQEVSSQVRSQISGDMPKIYKHIRMVLNNSNVLGTAVAGGGQPLAPNCAFDAGATSNVASATSTEQATTQNSSSQSSSGSSGTTSGKSSTSDTSGSSSSSSASSGNKQPKAGTAAAANWDQAVQFYKWAMMGKDAMKVYKPGTAKYKDAKEGYERNIRLYIEYAARAGIKVDANTSPSQAFASNSSGSTSTASNSTATSQTSSSQSQASAGNKQPKAGTAAADNWELAVQFYKWAMMGKDAMKVYTPGTAKYKDAKEGYERNIRLYVEYAARAGVTVDANTSPSQAFA
ncbi:MAG: hypothetical protein R3D28_20415 [Geminicoccaceae bacterium]